MKEQLSIRIDPAIKARMDEARKRLRVKESQTRFIEVAISKRCYIVKKDGTV